MICQMILLIVKLINKKNYKMNNENKIQLKLISIRMTIISFLSYFMDYGIYVFI